jgi:hypothetical protein
MFTECAENFKISQLPSLMATSPHTLQNPEHIPPASQATSLNSYKFPRPRQYFPNDFPTSEDTYLDRLSSLARHVGPKHRSNSYNDMHTKLLQLSKPKKKASSKYSAKPKPITPTLNNMVVSSDLKVIRLKLNPIAVQALVDTRASHCLVSVEAFQKILLH